VTHGGILFGVTVKPEKRIKSTIETDIYACPELRSLVIAEKIPNSNPMPIDEHIVIKTNIM
jgi:hypothetical protein